MEKFVFVKISNLTDRICIYPGIIHSDMVLYILTQFGSNRTPSHIAVIELIG